MTTVPWQKRTSSTPTLEQLEAEIEARLQFLEEDLRKRGMYPVCGAELEFFALDENGNPGRINTHVLKVRPDNFKPKSHIERVYQDGDDKLCKYEIVFGTLHRLHENFKSFYPSIEIARHVKELRRMLSEEYLWHNGKPKMSFASSRDHDNRATAGLHFNVSAYDANADNLFCNKDTMHFSYLADDTARFLVALQKDGLGLYTAAAESYKRFGRHPSAPRELRKANAKGNASVALRDSIGPDGPRQAELCRVEDRLPAADTNPYFPALAGIGSLWLAATHKKDVPFDGFDDPAPLLPNAPASDVVQQFEKSDLWKTIAGEKLHADIVAYCKARERGKSGVDI